jgi:hypothetical protein
MDLLRVCINETRWYHCAMLSSGLGVKELRVIDDPYDHNHNERRVTFMYVYRSK